MVDLMPPNPVPIHEPFLWWVGFETLLRHQKHDNIANQIFRQFKRVNEVSSFTEAPNSLYVITLGERTWKYIVAEFTRTGLPAYVSAGNALRDALETEVSRIREEVNENVR